MKFKDAFVGGVIAAAICLGIAWACKDRNTVVIPDNAKYEQAIDSLNKEVRKLEITNDSLISVITNSKGKIDTINNWYERSLLILLISLLPLMHLSSQNMYPKLVDDSLVVITPQQLKASNLIFLEHKKLKLERFELNKQLTSYELLTANYAKTDSIRLQQLARAELQMQMYDEAISKQREQIAKMNKKNKRLTTLSIGGFAISVGLLLALLIK